MKARSIIIFPVLNGFIVKVGCQEIVIRSISVLTSEIERYYKNPEEVEEEYLRTAVNKPGATNSAPAREPIPQAPPMAYSTAERR